MPLVFIPALLRKLTDGRESVEVEGKTLREVVQQLESRFPGIRERLLDGNEWRSGLAVAVDAQVGRLDLSHHVKETSEVHFVLAISGG